MDRDQSEIDLDSPIVHGSKMAGVIQTTQHESPIPPDQKIDGCRVLANLPKVGQINTDQTTDQDEVDNAV